MQDVAVNVPDVPVVMTSGRVSGARRRLWFSPFPEPEARRGTGRRGGACRVAGAQAGYGHSIFYVSRAI